VDGQIAISPLYLTKLSRIRSRIRLKKRTNGSEILFLETDESIHRTSRKDGVEAGSPCASTGSPFYAPYDFFKGSLPSASAREHSPVPPLMQLGAFRQQGLHGPTLHVSCSSGPILKMATAADDRHLQKYLAGSSDPFLPD